MSTTVRARSRTDVALVALRVGAALTLLVLLWQFLTAGRFLGPRGDESWVEAHAVGTIVLHVVSGLTVIAAAAHRWGRAEQPWWPTAVAALVFVLTFAQAWFGSHGMLALHVPGAMVLTVGVAALTAWSFGRR